MGLLTFRGKVTFGLFVTSQMEGSDDDLEDDSSSSFRCVHGIAFFVVVNSKTWYQGWALLFP